VVLVNVVGRQVYEDLHPDKNEIAIRIGEKGLYILRVKIQDRMFIKKVIRNQPNP